MYAVKAVAKRNPEKVHAWSGCEPITLSIQMQCDYHKAIKAPPSIMQKWRTGSWSLCEFVSYTLKKALYTIYYKLLKKVRIIAFKAFLALLLLKLIQVPIWGICSVTVSPPLLILQSCFTLKSLKYTNRKWRCSKAYKQGGSMVLCWTDLKLIITWIN